MVSIGYIIIRVRHISYNSHLLGVVIVGYDSIVYKIDESFETIELCAAVKKPESGGTPRPFTLTVSVSDGKQTKLHTYISKLYLN